MKLVKTIPHVGGLPEIFVFHCSRCKAETRVQEQTVTYLAAAHQPRPAAATAEC